jgi:ribosomal protein S3
MKAIKIFASGRDEIIAVRIKVKGRVNRWRRTKYIIGTRGTMPLQTISERIEQGTAQAINRKGAVGIRIWVRYKPSFLFLLQSHVFRYMQYSKLIKVQRRRKAILLK